LEEKEVKLKKVSKLRFLGILGVGIAVLFLMSTSFTQSQVKIQVKPPTEPEATWAVRIPNSALGNMFYGVEDGYYEDNDANIVVTVSKNEPGAWVRYFKFAYAFDFTITNENFGTGVPPANQVGFQSVGDLEVIEGAPTYQFPGGDILTFLNNKHPYSDGTGVTDYKYFWFRIHMFDQDIELMIPGDTYLFGDGPDPGEPADYLSVIARYQQECFPEPLYHDVELSRSINWARALDNGNPRNIMIERLDASAYEIECEAVWRFWVSDTGYSAGLPNGYLKVKERYCTIEQNQIEWYYPMEAKGTFNFYIDWIKNPGSTTPPEELPDAPTNLNADATACDRIDLSWTDNSDNEDGFVIERINDNSEFIVGAGVTSYSDTGLFENTAYSYRVRAYNDTGDSSFSNTASATTPSCNGTELPPDAPTGLTARAIGKAKIALKWTDNSTNEDGFYIYRDSGSGLILHATVGPDTSSYDDNQVSSTTYFYKVCAYNSMGESCSGTASATIK
jgi:hypothetical protein